MIKKSPTILISLVLIILCTQNSMCIWPFDSAQKTEKKHVHKEEIREFVFASGGTLHVENENNNNNNSSGSFFGDIINGRVIINDVEQDDCSAKPNNITIEGHDKELLELLIETESNDGNLECVSSELNIDEKNAFIKTVYKTKDCKASRSYTLKVPKKTFIKLLLAQHGSITAENIDDTIEKTKTSSGNITLKGINGDTTINNSFGTNTLERIKGNVSATNSSGKNSISHIKGNVNAKTSFGKNHIENIEGNATVETSSGDNRIINVDGDVSSKTSFGENDISHIQGSATVENSSGNNKLASIKEEVTAETSFGNNIYTLGDYPDATIEASTTFGQCKSDVPVTGKEEKKNIKGTIGKDGPLKTFKTSSGNIYIRK